MLRSPPKSDISLGAADMFQGLLPYVWQSKARYLTRPIQTSSQQIFSLLVRSHAGSRTGRYGQEKV
jgi:hypothetical protein